MWTGLISLSTAKKIKNEEKEEDHWSLSFLIHTTIEAQPRWFTNYQAGFHYDTIVVVAIWTTMMLRDEYSKWPKRRVVLNWGWFHIGDTTEQFSLLWCFLAFVFLSWASDKFQHEAFMGLDTESPINKWFKVQLNVWKSKSLSFGARPILVN